MRLMSLLFASILSFTTSCATTHRSPEADSFAFIMSQSPVTICDGGECTNRVEIGSGSGTVFWQGEEGTWVLTAGHVCANALKKDSSMITVASGGDLHPIITWTMSVEPDLCAILTVGKWGSVARVSPTDPKWGDKVWSIAAPRGIFMPGAPLLFEGTWSGVNDGGDAIVTMPCAPGSSGSSLRNERGEIVGVVHSTALNFGEIAIATPREQVTRFIANARSEILGLSDPEPDYDIEGKLPL